MLVLAVSVWPVTQVGSEFMPSLNEGTLLYMPTTLPGLSVTKAAELLQTQDRIIKSFPEVASVYGKAGARADGDRPGADSRCSRPSSTSSPRSEWRPGMTIDGLIAEMDKALQFPGVSNAWTMPIKARIDMLSTGIRTPVGVKVLRQGPRARWRSVARQIETVAQDRSRHVERLRRARDRRLLPRHRARPRAAGALWPDDRATCRTSWQPRSAARPITTTVEGRERYTVERPLSARLRSDPQAIAKDVLVPLPERRHGAAWARSPTSS